MPFQPDIGSYSVRPGMGYLSDGIASQHGWGADYTGQADEARQNLDAIGLAFRLRDDVVWHAYLSGIRRSEIARRCGLSCRTVLTIIEKKKRRAA